MITEHPDYFDHFSCVGGKCEDTCCAGWEVDIDEETFYYYMTVKSDFGDRLRSHMVDTGEEKYFPLAKNGRCPFLNSGNWCDIYSNLGPDRLCTVCQEYPRYYVEVGDYTQEDMSLSCMELGRIFFERKSPISYAQLGDGDYGLDGKEEKLFQTILGKRDAMIRQLQANHGSYLSRMDAALSLLDSSDEKDSTEILLAKLSSLEVIDEGWKTEFDRLKTFCQQTDYPVKKKHFLAWTGLTEDQGSLFSSWFTRLAVYFCFRYTIDLWFDQDPKKPARMIRRSLSVIWLMCLERWSRCSQRFDIHDMIDIAHLYSKEVEHSEENVERMKGRAKGVAKRRNNL